MQGRAADAGFLIAQLVHDLGLESVALGPAAVHAHEHLGPVARLGAAGAGLDAEVGVAGVLGAAEHRLELEFAQALLYARQLGFQLALQAVVLFGQLRKGFEVACGGLQFFVRLDEAVERLQLLDYLLGFFLVVPEVGLPHLFGEAVAEGGFAGDVKDCPGAG